jgi:hypothetical protein
VEFEVAWQADEERVDALLKEANRYVGALKAWKKACQIGHFNNRQKAAAQAEFLAPALASPTAAASSAWTFDVRDYLSGEAWRQEIMAVAATDKFDLRVLEENDTLVSSPVVVRALPGRSVLQIGRVNWPALRPKVVAAELKRLRERTGASNSQEFLESLYAVWDRLKNPDMIFLRFREIYDLFSLTPGWKRENPPAKFGQDIYALHRSGLETTRGGKKFEMVTPSATAKEREIYTVISEDGRPLRYHGIRFKNADP